MKQIFRIDENETDRPKMIISLYQDEKGGWFAGVERFDGQTSIKSYTATYASATIATKMALDYGV